MQFAEILFQQKIGTQDTLTYQIPPGFDAKLGQAVEVKMRNRSKQGIIWKIHSNKPDFRTAPLQEIVQTKPLVTKLQIDLIKWMSKYYFCPTFALFKLFIPSRILAGKPVKTRKKEAPPVTKQDQKTLTPLQQDAFNTIKTSEKNNFLIHGITGSGKTEIYSRLAEDFINKGKQVLLLVPEISLTPQTISYFENAIGVRAAVMHSKLSEGERTKAWIDTHKNEAKLIIGSRSAIFAPFRDLGLIIIDEEHENSYKQDSSPRYHTHKVAEKIQELNPKIKIVFGSATPSVETKEKLKDSTMELNERIGESELPDIEIIDLRDEFKKQNHSIFSERLHTEITNALAKKEQVILFLNRRGSASSVVCRDCGQTEECRKCEMPFTYHSRTLEKPGLICHHCGDITTPPSICPNCKGPNIRHLGIGTQKIETELLKEFPQARVLRADKDTTSAKDGFKKIYESFKKHEADILVGTQMIAKGLHLPKVNLVGVILADIGLSIPDFRTTERNLQLMTQVAGRAGRSGTKGKVIIQTYDPANIALTHAKNHDFEGFFQYERTQRSLMKNPPFSHLAKVLIEESTLKEAQEKAEKAERLLWQSARELSITENLEILTYPAYLTRLRGKYRYIILIKDTAKSGAIHKLLEKLPKPTIMDPNFKIDIDPISIT